MEQTTQVAKNRKAEDPKIIPKELCFLNRQPMPLQVNIAPPPGREEFGFVGVWLHPWFFR